MYLNDVTLREGDQMPGRSYTVEQKVTAGQTLDELGLEFIQAGFPVTGSKDQQAISDLAKTTAADIIGLARAREGDIDAALDAQADVVEIFLSISDSHLEHVLGMDREQALETLHDAVTYATDHGARIHVSLADAFRADLDHIIPVFERFDDVEYITLADTVGARTPMAVEEFLNKLNNHVQLDRVGVHFHDDMGVATANALTARELGVGKADVSVAALGERAGNPALEEVVVAGQTEQENSFGIATDNLIPVCQTVLETLDEEVDPRKAILGSEVMEHESGIHTAAMLEEPSVFEPFNPNEFGGNRRLVFGGGTGQAGARKLLERAGIEPTDDRVDEFQDVLSDQGPVDTETAITLAQDQLS